MIKEPKYKFDKKDNYYLTIDGFIKADLVKIANSKAVTELIKQHSKDENNIYVKDIKKEFDKIVESYK